VHGERLFTREVPQRVDVIRAALAAARMAPIVPPADYGIAPIMAVHDAAYIAYLRSAYQDHAIQTGHAAPVFSSRSAVDPRRMAYRPADFPNLADFYTYDFEDPIVAGTWDAAYWSAQAALSAAGHVRDTEGPAYALCRPPGHHATHDQYGGFCYLNNAAIAAHYLSRHGRVVILDVDYHHGNGTQSIFYDDASVMYASLHGDPAADYPYYWGYADETGTGPGLGTNLNLPLPIGADDALYLDALDQALDVVLAFSPDWIVISLGLDAVAGDPIGKFNLTPSGWIEVGRRIAALNLPAVLVQEGGYNLATLGSNVVGFLQAFVEEPKVTP